MEKLEGRLNALSSAKKTFAVCSGFGVGGGITYFLLHNADGKAWDKLIRDMVTALWQKNGPLAGLLFVILIVMFVSDRMHVRNLINAKNEEITRLVEERDKLQEKLGIPHPTSQKKGCKTR